MFGLVVSHIGFVHFRPLKVVLILIGIFKVDLTAWSKLTAVENHLVRKAIIGLVVNHTESAHIRLIKVVLIHFQYFSTIQGGFKVVFIAW